ncbi:MAG: hypothetical protein WCL39_11170, partial [Armatimonadota bacterium]
SYIALLSPGDNSAKLTIPGKFEAALTLTASKALASEKALATYITARNQPIPLPQDKLISDTDWGKLRTFYAYGHGPWNGSRPPLEAFAGKTEIAKPGDESVIFRLENRRFLPVSAKNQSPSVTLGLNGATYKKLYLLVIPFLDNHDTYAKVARIDVATSDAGIHSRTLTFPGDLDWWCPEAVVGDFSTARVPRPNRFALNSLLKATDADWKEAALPAFPQPDFWATCQAVKTSSSVMNVIEIDLGKLASVKSLTFSAIGVDPAFGIVAVTGEGSANEAMLAGTGLLPPARFREPRTIFRMDTDADIANWKLEGTAFSVSSNRSLFQTPTLNSLTKSGENATGKAISPDFKIEQDDKSLMLQIQGGNSRADSGAGSLRIDLVDSATGKVLDKQIISGSHMLRGSQMNVSKWPGRTVHLELVDENIDITYAWLGVKEAKLSPN